MKSLVCLLVLAAAGFSAPADIAGSWILHLVQSGEETSPARVELKVDGDKVTGTLNELTLDGTLQGNVLHLKAVRPNGGEFGILEGQVNGAELRGTAHVGNDNIDWVARRVPAASTEPPQTRSFAPTKFYRYFSGTLEPALHINPGDTVRTTTVDAGGSDASGARRSMGGNPETGPFYVEGAMPGDTLVVKFNRIRLNRDSAGSGTTITSDALNAGYIHDAKYEDKFSGEWKLDREAGTAMLATPSEHLKDYRVKLQPMLGCVAVAPPDKQTFRSGWLGSYGGNMDFNGLREGVTLYLPVYQEGALLFVGDGHAAQGDGELTGDALETSMDVEFTVNLVHGQATGGPRAESDEYLMSMGISNSLPDAVRQATTQLARWLERDYRLTPNESAIVLGTAIQYNIAELVDPQVNVVAKISKTALAGLKK